MSTRTTNILDAWREIQETGLERRGDNDLRDEDDWDNRPGDYRPIELYRGIPEEIRHEAISIITQLAQSFGPVPRGSFIPDRLAFYVTFRAQHRPWGIHYCERSIVDFVWTLYQQFGDKFGSVLELANKVIYAITIHELFHYRVDVFALNLELATCIDIYRPYKSRVYRPSLHTPDCLEEALANASTLVRSLATFRECLYTWYSRCTDGYKQFDDYDRPETFDKGLVLLMNQIRQGHGHPTSAAPHWFPNLDYDDPFYGSIIVPRYVVEQTPLPEPVRLALFAKPYRCGKI